MDNQTLMLIGYVVVIFGFMYLFLIRPQKKKEKQLQSMIGSLKVGDNVVTMGGVVGKVVLIKDDEVVIETGIDRTKIELKKFAVKDVTPNDTGVAVPDTDVASK
jgi:preprotein translocase subunit YajC